MEEENVQEYEVEEVMKEKEPTEVEEYEEVEIYE